MEKNKNELPVKGVNELKQEKQKLEKTVISRRAFLSKAGTIIAAGALSHFVFIGRVNAANQITKSNACNMDCAVGTCVTVLGEEACNQQFSCDPTAEYKCGAMTGNTDSDPKPCTNDCTVPYVTDCFVGLFDAE